MFSNSSINNNFNNSCSNSNRIKLGKIVWISLLRVVRLIVIGIWMGVKMEMLGSLEKGNLILFRVRVVSIILWGIVYKNPIMLIIINIKTKMGNYSNPSKEFD